MEAERTGSRATSEATTQEVDTAPIATQATAPADVSAGEASGSQVLGRLSDMKATSSEGDVKREAATSQQDTKDAANTSLSTAAKYSFRIAPIDKDGNCLFRAIAEQLQRPPW
ncbi:MAG: hypothetical protein AAFQ78_00720, partial [Bacteroidota bacterium]